MEGLSIALDDLPDEILLIIFEKLNNIILLNSLIGVNKRLNRIVRDSIFTRHLSETIIDQFCSAVLPIIHHNIKWLDLESSSMNRILHATDYPNLYGLGLYNMKIKTALYYSSDESSIPLNRDQISSLVIDLENAQTQSSFKHVQKQIYLFRHIINVFPNLRCLNFNPYASSCQYLLFPRSLISFNSSNLLELHISLQRFCDCLYMLDGRFSQLRKFHVKISNISSSQLHLDNKEKLPNLRCFSLHCYEITTYYEELILPLLHRMSSLKELDLDLYLSVKKTFIEGDNLKTNIIDRMSRLDKFTFNIASVLDFDHQTVFLSNDDIQTTFKNFKSNNVISCIKHFQEKQFSRCLVYTYSCELRHYHRISNNFPGGLFKNVREISLFDEHPFEHEFFVKLQKSFPLMTKLIIRNLKPQKNKLEAESNSDNDNSSIVEYSHLALLSLNRAHYDYTEEFLLDTKTRLPNNLLLLNICYRKLKIVTHSFTRDSTRINCTKLKCLCLSDAYWVSKYVKAYFPNTEIC